MLWQELLAEVRRYGVVDAIDANGFDFRQPAESTGRRFQMSPELLRDGFVNDIVRTGSGAEVPHLPQWFLDEVVEFIGSNEEPYDHRYVVLAGTRLVPSQDGQHPDFGSSAAPPSR
ncbi:UNVERIFIED_CONTAM: hypothetical protein LK11_43730 [Mumia flava]|uniref:hypothetical protein n=1 Tax=Mumia flava TaxID=1348852 RepID=UPI0005737D65|nr:hypothetical protein [Mumia flava]